MRAAPIRCIPQREHLAPPNELVAGQSDLGQSNTNLKADIRLIVALPEYPTLSGIHVTLRESGSIVSIVSSAGRASASK
jgi:hypothetical protein